MTDIAKAIERRRAGSPSGAGNQVPTSSPASARSIVSGVRPEAMIAWQPDRAAIVAASTLERMPPRPAFEGPPPAMAASESTS